MKDHRPKPRSTPQEGVILFTVGGFKFAIAAGSVKEIRGTTGLHEFKLRGVDAQMDKLRFTLERDGTTFFVIDAKRYFHLNQSVPGRVLILRTSATALLVDSTDRMLDITALHALPRAFTQDERGWYRGLAVVNGEVVPVVNPDSFLTKGERELLRAGLERVRGVSAV